MRSTARHCAAAAAQYGAALRSTALRCAHLFIFRLCKSSDVNTEMTDDDDVLAIAYWYLVCNNEQESTKKRKRKKKRKRRFWIHDVITRWDELGEYHRPWQSIYNTSRTTDAAVPWAYWVIVDSLHIWYFCCCRYLLVTARCICWDWLIQTVTCHTVYSCLFNCFATTVNCWNPLIPSKE